MRLAFMGTPEFSVKVLAELIAAGHDIAAVYTRAPQPSGRGHKLTPSPVHKFAGACGLEVRTPKNFKDEEERAAFAALDLDVAVVVAYGLILPQAVLDAPRHGCLNLHASLLPRWRGAAPIQRAIMAGDQVTGVQVMRMEAGLDTGPVLLSETVEIAAEDTAGSLHHKLAAVAAQLGPRALAALTREALMETPQSEEGVTYANKISSTEARIDWTNSAEDVDRHIRGLSPFPGAWFETDGARVKALFSKVSDGGGPPGAVVEAGDKLLIACGAGAVELVTLQRAGKKPQQAEGFLRGFPLKIGQTL
ncbi:methionyl-tRNA formyltransferase [Hyphococcus flavus]|uniref:Methionyl-tRNA formyltransferase n=1 Tax=Hyphococcus flavus TaxID=1866326 RepID=A0AAE9ZHE4_9PROT|nr:methionyl-tRNA formyltransferase [Hyphococcus flavus]WDI32852.1 methionyl-tRNA formyltransferase [Hyphococcus flavus]